MYPSLQDKFVKGTLKNVDFETSSYYQMVMIIMIIYYKNALHLFFHARDWVDWPDCVTTCLPVIDRDTTQHNKEDLALVITDQKTMRQLG